MDLVVGKLGFRNAKDANEQKVHGPTKILHHNQDIENTLNLNLENLGDQLFLPKFRRKTDQRPGESFRIYKLCLGLTKFLNQNGRSCNSKLFSLSGMF